MSALRKAPHNHCGSTIGSGGLRFKRRKFNKCKKRKGLLFLASPVNVVDPAPPVGMMVLVPSVGVVNLVLPVGVV